MTWKPDGSELMFLDKQDTLSVVDTRTMKVVRTHRYAYVVAPPPHRPRLCPLHRHSQKLNLGLEVLRWLHLRT